MHGHDDATSEPDASVGGEVERLVGDADLHRLIGGEPGARQCIAHRLRVIQKFGVGNAGEGLARGEAPRRLGEERAEIQARREIERVGG